MGKTIKNRITLTLASVLSLAFTQVSAQDFQKGTEALEAGDFARAFKEWEPLAEKGDDDAQFNLGLMYDRGEGVAQDSAEAVKWYRLAAEQGNPIAQNSLGGFYYSGIGGVLKDHSEAVKWYRLAAKQGDNHGQFNLGLMYTYGNGVQQDNLKAHMWYNIASANGSVSGGKERDKREVLMSKSDITKATAMARECMASDYKKCGY